jgi:hypothetical protein
MAMLKQPMVEKLLGMRLHGMAEPLKTQEQDPAARELSFLGRLGMLVDQQWTWRENQALARRNFSCGELTRGLRVLSAASFRWTSFVSERFGAGFGTVVDNAVAGVFFVVREVIAPPAFRLSPDLFRTKS